LNLLIDENLSPRIARWACEAGYPAEAAAHVGLAGAPDEAVFKHAYQRSQVVVTVNVGDFMALAAGMDLHPGVIALREAELSAEEQWQRVRAALAYVERRCRGDLLNHVLEVQNASQLAPRHPRTMSQTSSTHVQTRSRARPSPRPPHPAVSLSIAA